MVERFWIVCIRRGRGEGIRRGLRHVATRSPRHISTRMRTERMKGHIYITFDSDLRLQLIEESGQHVN